MGLPAPTVGGAALVASILIPLAQVLTPAAQEYLTQDKRIETDSLVQANRLALERESDSRRHKEELADIVLTHYIGKSPSDQSRAIVIITVLFPDQTLGLQEALNRYAANDTIRAEAEAAVAKVVGVGESRLQTARSAEQMGFQALALGDIAQAHAHFNDAYAAYPTYHNVDEIKQKLDTFSDQGPKARAILLNGIVRENSWRMPAEVKGRILQRAQD
jgi:hypothetical protein